MTTARTEDSTEGVFAPQSTEPLGPRAAAKAAAMAAGVPIPEALIRELWRDYGLAAPKQPWIAAPTDARPPTTPAEAQEPPARNPREAAMPPTVSVRFLEEEDGSVSVHLTGTAAFAIERDPEGRISVRVEAQSGPEAAQPDAAAIDDPQPARKRPRVTPEDVCASIQRLGDGNPVRASAIASDLGLPKPTAARLIARAEDAQLITAIDRGPRTAYVFSSG